MDEKLCLSGPVPDIPLKACPYCGADAEFSYNFFWGDTVDECYATCTNEHCLADSQDVSGTFEEAAQAWNKHTTRWEHLHERVLKLEGERMRPEDKNPMWLTIKEKCQMGCQCCDECSDMKCDDNSNPLVARIRELEATQRSAPAKQAEE